jgi:hypothetical protein
VNPDANEDHEADPAAEQRAAVTSELGDELLAHRTPQQKEIAGRIYQQLRAGSQVDDIKPLIADLSRTATRDARDARATRRTESGGAR